MSELHNRPRCPDTQGVCIYSVHGHCCHVMLSAHNSIARPTLAETAPLPNVVRLSGSTIRLLPDQCPLRTYLSSVLRGDADEVDVPLEPITHEISLKEFREWREQNRRTLGAG